MAAAQAGDKDAFAQLIEGEATTAYRMALVILGSPTEAQDATQDACLRAWRDLPRLRHAARWQAWFRKLAVHAAQDRARRLRRIPEIRIQPDDGMLVSDPTAAIVARDRLRRGFRQLSADDRSVLTLRYYSDLTVPDIAEVLDIPLGTAKARLHRALARLRAVLGEDSA